MALESEVFHVLYNRKKFHTSIYKKFNSEYSDRALESEVFHVLYNRKKFHTSIKKKINSENSDRAFSIFQVYQYFTIYRRYPVLFIKI